MKPLASLPRPALRKAQAARNLGVCDPVIDRLIREKRLRAFRPTPDTVRILPNDLEAFIEAHATIPVQAAFRVYRQILEAISRVHGEIGETDFTCVVQCVEANGKGTPWSRPAL